MAKKINENVVVLEEYTTNVEVPTVGTVEHRLEAINENTHRKYVYRRTNTYIYVGYTNIVPTIVGKKVFNRYISYGITYKNNKIYSNLPLGITYSFLLSKIPKFEWVKEVPPAFSAIIRDKNILKQILKGKITSKTGLLKSAGRIHFKGNYSSKNIETIMTKSILSIYDLDAFCREGAKGYLDRLEHIERSIPISLRGYEALLRDLIMDHKQIGDDYFFSCKWSVERLQREHQHSIMLLKQADFERCSTQIKVDCIYKEMLPAYVDLIDNERLSCEQASVYDNCSYRIYWPQVEKGKYILLVDNKDHIMVGICIREGRLYIDQYHTYHNGYCDRPKWLLDYVNFHNERAGSFIKYKDEEIEYPF